MSIARVAEAAHVSYATAWRIINNRPCSSETAIKAVKRAVRQVGYEPSPGPTRRGRPSKMIDGIRTRNVALLQLRGGTALSTSVIGAVQRRLAERDLNLMFAQIDTASSLPPALRNGGVDGILGYGKFPDEAITPQLRRIPAVWMMSRNDRGVDRFGDRVMPDHAAIGDMAANFVVGRGHRRVAVINPHPESEIYRLRCEAFLAAAKRARIQTVYLADDGETDVDDVVGILVDRWIQEFGVEPNSSHSAAIFVPADEIALLVHRQFRRKGIKLAEPVSSSIVVRGSGVEIVSSDNDRELMPLMRPAPQTIDLNREAIAELAIDRLFWRMRHGLSQPQVTLQVRPTLVHTPPPSGDHDF